MRIKKTFIEVLITLLVISWTSLVFALLSDLKVNSWDPLTSTLWNWLVDHSVPSWAVMAFDLSACPTWWTEYTALQWKFIRGADTWANNDPDFTSRTGGIWARKIWSTQIDEFKSHTHVYWDWNTSWWNYWGNVRTAQSDHTAMPVSVKTISYAWWNETRPKNVYLLYCKKD